MADYGTFLAVAGVGVVAFDVYAYYQYKHALDVTAESEDAFETGDETVVTEEAPVEAQLEELRERQDRLESSVKGIRKDLRLFLAPKAKE
jgi:hypothetical protein